MTEKSNVQRFIQTMLILGAGVIGLATIGTGAAFGFGSLVVTGLVGMVGLLVFGRLMMQFLQMVDDE
ncbi:MAG: hypothetical protein AAF902_25015 [Chloroflexota bacterium]